MTALLQLDGLGIGFGDGDDPTRVVDGVSLCLQAGEVTALVGESGSGKTLVTRAILDLLPPGGRVTDGKILFRQEPLHSATSQRIRALRGAEIGLILQEPLTSLNPSMRIGDQLIESLRWHRDLDERQSRMLAVDMLEKLDIRDPESCMRKYPHEFSGGMRQRILIASVLLLRPSLVIADEPTTALDVLVQKQVLDAMLEIVRESETAVLLITHDLALAARYSDRVAVMQRGSLVECGEVSEILLRPRHEYTRKLLASMPKPRPASTARKSTEPAVVAENVTVRFRGRRQLPWKPAPALDAVDGVSLSVYPGETLVVVGESGSGKSTLARAMLGLLPLETGVVRYDGVDPGRLAGAELRALRRRTQMVFQDPYSSLDPRQTVIEIVAEGLRSADKLSTAQVRERAADILTEVGLGTSFAERYPHELSGGQRQRVNIARALVGQPEFVVADEPVSSLDITVQAEILELFNRLREQRSFSCLFITHDLGVARQVGDRIAVMCRGRIVEQGRPDQIFDSPCHPYTCELLEAAPLLNEEAGPSYGLANQRIERSTLPGGYRVATGAGSRADSDQPPELLELGPEHYVECVRTRSPAELRNLETES